MTTKIKEKSVQEISMIPSAREHAANCNDADKTTPGDALHLADKTDDEAGPFCMLLGLGVLTIVGFFGSNILALFFKAMSHLVFV